MDGTWIALGAVGALALAGAARRGSFKQAAPWRPPPEIAAAMRQDLPRLRAKNFPSARVRQRRLREAALAGAHGRDWYQHAEQEIRTAAKAWGLPPVAVAVAVAATSPATKVVESKRIRGQIRPMTKGGGPGSNIAKARGILKAWAAGKPATTAPGVTAGSPGYNALREFEDCWFELAKTNERACLLQAFPDPDHTKTHAFVRNLLGDENAVTVDSLIGRGVGVVPTGRKAKRIDIKSARYRNIVRDIRLVARRLGWPPREVMAAAWTAWGGTGRLGLATTRQRARVARGSGARALPPELGLAVIREHGVTFETGRPVSLHFMRNTEPTPRLPKHVQPQFGQDIEPTGRYMLHASSSWQPVATWVGGEVTFQSPIVLEHRGTSSHHPGWKRRLSDAFGGKKGAALTRAILAAGYDGIVTVDQTMRTVGGRREPLRHTSEMVQLLVPQRRRRRR